MKRWLILLQDKSLTSQQVISTFLAHVKQDLGGQNFGTDDELTDVVKRIV